jgi:hypothetical protein
MLLNWDTQGTTACSTGDSIAHDHVLSELTGAGAEEFIRAR